MTAIRFLMVGGVGFAVDASVFYGVSQIGGGSWALARVCAFLVAVCVTWQGNRRWTFKSVGAPLREIQRYVIVQITGCLINYATFMTVLDSIHHPKGWIVAYLVGSASAAFFNYHVSRRLVFSLKHDSGKSFL